MSRQLELFNEEVADPRDDNRVMVFDMGRETGLAQRYRARVSLGWPLTQQQHMLPRERVVIAPTVHILASQRQRFVNVLSAAQHLANEQDKGHVNNVLQRINSARMNGVVVTPFIHDVGIGEDWNTFGVLDWSERGGFRVRQFAPSRWLRRVLLDYPFGAYMTERYAITISNTMKVWMKEAVRDLSYYNVDRLIDDAATVLGEVLAAERRGEYVEILRGMDIVHGYARGPKSCMKGRPPGRLALYAENPETIGLMVVAKGQAIHARRLIFTLNDGRLIAENIYQGSDAAAELLEAECNQQGIIDGYAMYDGHGYIKREFKGVYIPARWPSSGSFPYLDRFCWIGPEPNDRRRIRMYPNWNAGGGYDRLLLAQSENGRLLDSLKRYVLNRDAAYQDELEYQPNPPWYDEPDEVLLPEGWLAWTEQVEYWANRRYEGEAY
jgi:hypothetical protein